MATKKAFIILFAFLGTVAFLLLIDHPKPSKNSQKVNNVEEIKQNKLSAGSNTPNDYFESLSKKNLTINFPVLYYHYVEYPKDPLDTKRRSLTILPSNLELQIKELIKNGYSFYFVSEIPEYFSKDFKKGVALSFDDGYRDFYTDALPILEKYNAKATIYIISGVLDGENYLTTNQVKILSNNPLIEIGSHTWSHKNLAQIPFKDAEFEINQGKKQLEDVVGRNIYSFAYPYGGNSVDIQKMVLLSGFLNAVTTENSATVRSDNLFAIPRIRASGITALDLIFILNKQSQK